MARPKKNQAPDLKVAQELTDGLIERLTCPPGTFQAFIRDTKAPGLRVRVTPPSAKNPEGVKAFVYEAKLRRQTIRRTLGDVRTLTIDGARAQARELATTIKNEKQDPRELDRVDQATKTQAAADAAALAEAGKVASLTVGEVWKAYIAERTPFWGDLHRRDHEDKAKAGGLPSGRRGGGKSKTKPGPLAALMPLALKDLNQTTVETWAATEGKTRPASARLAWRLLTVFLTWCAQNPTYAALLPVNNPAKTKKAREALGKAGVKKDVLQRGQLAAWFAAVQSIPNRAISACLQIMLLTGARPGEVLALRWEDINTQWKGINIRDKVEGEREIPATPYVLELLSSLPRVNDWVFASARFVKGIHGEPGRWVNTSATGRMSEPNTPHTRACRAAGLEGLTLHGLRRSFKSLTEWLEVPAGVVAQIQGHKPSATAEKHYTVRPLELLALHHTHIEKWILEQAKVPFEPKAETAKVELVATA